MVFGQGIHPTGYHPLTDGLSEDQIAKVLGNVKAVIAQTVQTMKTHEAFIAANCKASAPSSTA